MNTTQFWLSSLALLVGACAPVATHSDAEAPKHLALDTARTSSTRGFAPDYAAFAVVNAPRLPAGRRDRRDHAAGSGHRLGRDAPYVARERVA